MTKSESISNIATALTAFQGEVPAIEKDGNNPFFKSKYATLENIIKVIKPLLLKHGLSFSQFPSGEHGLTTILMHASGEWIESEVSTSPKDNTPQALGSALTYMRRYALSAVLGLATESDDDGEATVAHTTAPVHAPIVANKEACIKCGKFVKPPYEVCYTCNQESKKQV